MKILIIDNYDSFTYNLFQYVGEILDSYSSRERSESRSLEKISSHRQMADRTISNFTIDVIYNDKIIFNEIKKRKYDRIIISPGPGNPTRKRDFGISRQIIQDSDLPVLGVCLGHQGIGAIFGAKITQAPTIMHGKPSRIYHTGEGIFKDIPQGFEAIRYHSLIVDKKTLPLDIKKIAWTDEGEIMGLKHNYKNLWGVQFHPESIGTGYGRKLLENFLKIAHEK